MKDTGKIVCETMNAQALVDDLTRRNVPESEMAEARLRLQMAQLGMMSHFKVDVSLPPGQQWRLYEEGELVAETTKKLKEWVDKRAKV